MKIDYELRTVAIAKQKEFLEDILNHKESIELLIIPNSKCNLGCNYCAPKGFLTKNTKYQRMSKDKIDKILNLAEDFKRRTGAKINLELHGYEPLLVGKDTFEYIARKAKDSEVSMIIQTNCVLLDEEWVGLIKDYNVGVGVSIDGPEDIHNSNRKFHSGKGSYNQVMRGIKHLRNNNLDFGVISVLSKAHTSKNPEIYYNWLLDNNFVQSDIHLPGTPSSNQVFSNFMPSISELKDYILCLYDLWKSKKDGLVIRTFANFAQSIIKEIPPPGACTMNSGCQKIISFNFNGDISLCDSNVYKIMNIENLESIEDLILHPSMVASFLRPILIAENEESCRNCDYLKLCNGGCTHEGMVETGSPYTKTKFCEVYKSLYSKIKCDLIKMNKVKF